MSVFLRGSGFSLRAVEEHKEFEARLAAPGISVGIDRAIVFGVHDASDALVGVLGLEGIDWVRRTARLTARGDAPLEAVGLVVRYAFGELNLDRVEAVVMDASWAGVLEGAGFAAGAPKGGENVFVCRRSHAA